MSVIHCESCDKFVDTDFDAEHEARCQMEGYDWSDHYDEDK